MASWSALPTLFIPLTTLIATAAALQFASVARTTAADNTFLVAIVGASRNIDGDAVNIERLIRQHLIVRNAQLSILNRERLDTFSPNRVAVAQSQ